MWGIFYCLGGFIPGAFGGVFLLLVWGMFHVKHWGAEGVVVILVLVVFLRLVRN